MVPQIVVENILCAFLKDPPDENYIRTSSARFSSKDWNSLYALSTRLGLTPLLWHRSRLLPQEFFPDFFRKQIKNVYRANAIMSSALERELKRILGLFQAASLDVIPLKGPILGQLLYGDSALRQTIHDLDLCIHPEDLPAAERLLMHAGYRCSDGEEGSSSRLHRLAIARQLTFERSQKQECVYSIDLHLDMRPAHSKDQSQEVWKRLIPSDWNGLPVLTLPPEDLAWFLALSIFPVREFTELRYVHDFHRLIVNTGSAFDWDVVVRRYEKTAYGRCLFFSLALSKELFSTPVPARVFFRLKPGLVRRLVLSFWLHKNHCMRRNRNEGIVWYYFFTSWFVIGSSLLYSRGVRDFFLLSFRKVFPSGAALSSQSSAWDRRKFGMAYGRRLVRPFVRLFRCRSSAPPADK